MISYISLLSILLLFAAEIYCGAIEPKRSNYTETVDLLYFDYDYFAKSISTLSRAYSARLLTSSAMVVSVQQNVHAILKLVFGEYQLNESFPPGARVGRNEGLRVQRKSDIKAIDALNEAFIEYFEYLGCFFVARGVWNHQRGDLSLEYHAIDVVLPHVGVLYGTMIDNGINLDLMLRIFPRIINLYEADFETRTPSSSYFTKVLNEFVKEFIWKHFQPKNGILEYPPPSLMKRLAKDLFRRDLNAQICTIKQGHRGHLYAHIISKPCTVYDDKTFIAMGYLKNSIRCIEKCKMPTPPSSTSMRFEDSLCYCISTYNLSKCTKVNIFDDFKERERGTSMSLLSMVIPLVRIPEGTVLITYIVFPKNCFINILNSKQKSYIRKVKDNDKVQGNERDRVSSMMISDEQLCIFMKYFANYLYTDANKYLHEGSTR